MDAGRELTDSRTRYQPTTTVGAMSDLLHSLQNVPAPFNMIVLLAVIGGFVAVLCTAIVQVRLFAEHRADLQLKRELVERGLSADEIERVVASKSSSKKQC